MSSAHPSTSSSPSSPDGPPSHHHFSGRSTSTVSVSTTAPTSSISRRPSTCSPRTSSNTTITNTTTSATAASTSALPAVVNTPPPPSPPPASTPPVDEHPLSKSALDKRSYHSFLCLGRPFHVEKRWQLVRELGQGAYGLVVSAQDEISGEIVAVKMITRVLDKVVLARRALREITLLRHFASHENITGLIDLDVVHSGFNEVYMFMEPMEADLHQIIRSGQLLSNSHVQYFMYQLFRGLKYIHSAHVLHRDIKPGNVLVNADCELKICDFGLARGFHPDSSSSAAASAGSPLTEYVATRWYRAPEIMLSYRRYTTAIDVWSVGCILAELLGGKPVFKGKDYVDQLNLILSVLGTPDDETLARVGSEKAGKYIRSLEPSEPVAFESLFPEADEQGALPKLTLLIIPVLRLMLAIDLLSQLLVFDPDRRISAVEALEHPYLASYHDESDEPSCPVPFDKWVEVESLSTIDEFRVAIEREVNEFRAEVRAVDELEPSWTEAENEGLGVGEDGHGLVVSGESPMWNGAEGAVEPKGSKYVSEMLAAGGGGGAGSQDDERVGGGREQVDGLDLEDGGRVVEVPPPTPSASASTSSHARSTSRSSIHRRPSSGFFSDPFGRRTPHSLTFTPSPTTGGPSALQSPTQSSSSALPSASDPIRPPRSRHHSQSGDAMIRPLLRSLSTISITDALGKGFALGGFSKMSPAPPISPPPLAVSPSDAPPSAPPLQFRDSDKALPTVSN